MSLERQRKIIQLFNNLFASGFHLGEIIDFLKRSQLLADSYTQVMKAGLMAGKPFSELLADLQFSDSVVTQVSLAETHGNTGLSLVKIEDYLANLARVRKKLVEVATYPFMLLGLLILIMLGLKNYLLPQMEEGNVATILIGNLPIIFIGNVLVVLALVLLSRFLYRKMAKIKVFRFLVSLPIIGGFVQSYLTAYYAREWGNLIGQGLEMTQILTIMQEQKSALFREIGSDMEHALYNGIAFHDQIKAYPFFKRELSLIIEYGQVKSKLGSELEIYANESWEEFFRKIQAAMQWIQPIIFIFVALIIVLIYAAMLLPIYQNMEI